MSNIIHFSVDDCIEMFRDITVNNYNSLFDSKYFSFFKYLHDRYKACISLYVFIEYKGFNISNTSVKYKKEFSENSNWLKIGFHGYNENSRYNSNKNTADKDYKLFLKYVYRFTGSNDIIDNIPRLHCFSGNALNITKMKKLNNGIIGVLTADDDRDNYYLKNNENIFLNKHLEYKDIKNNILFIKTTLRIENISDIDIAVKTIDLNNNIIMFTHEIFLDNDNIKNNITKIYDYALENSYSPSFIQFENKLLYENFPIIKRYIECHIPVTTCNLRCEYCYITQTNRWSDALPNFKYSPQYVRKALSKERMGGVCLLNMCADGETLMHEYVIELIKEVLEEGHYVFVVTNGTVNKRFDEILQKIDKSLLYRLVFKFSFHYKELLRVNKIKDYFSNVKKMKDAGCSFTVELTPYDEIIKDIENIKNIVRENVGNICHVTIARSDDKYGIPILTNLSRDEYKKTWEVFDSNLFNFKIGIFGKRIDEYCYAGVYSLFVNIGTGETRQCYASNYHQNIFEDINKPISFKPIGEKCLLPHCFNAHAFITLGDVPKIDAPFYADVRNRVCADGSEWLNPYIKEIFSHKLNESHSISIFNNMYFLKKRKNNAK
ncbi:radical SAM protein [uncultured Brachyspira sp.]|uniref:radical SAM protein n=1 Tax=uncultured Brachyspira sp. TaxID=221953 RepID=UPI0026119851|nr:radical SAM protein [uncultured Brachyspira sp.]